MAKFTKEELEKKIADAVAPYRRLGLPLAQFKLQDVTELFLTSANFLKITKVFSSLTSPEVVDGVLTQAVKAGMLDSVERVSLKEFIRICEWMRTRPGQRSCQDVQQAVRLKRKAGDHSRSVEDFTYVQIFRMAQQDLAEQKKWAGPDSDQKVEDLKVVSEFNVKRKGEKQIKNPNVDDDEVFDYCRERSVRESLRDYLEKRIVELDSRFDVRKASTCRAYMAAISSPVEDDVAEKRARTGVEDCLN